MLSRVGYGRYTGGTAIVSDILVIGDAIVDFVFSDIGAVPDPGGEITANQFECRVGGSAGYAAMGLAKFDMSVDLETQIGNGPLSDMWLETVQKTGVGTELINRVPNRHISTAAALLIDDNRRFITHRGALACSHQISAHLGRYDAILITGFSQAPYLWSGQNRDIIRSIRAMDVSLLVDTNHGPEEWYDHFYDIAPAIDYLLVNESELLALSGMTERVTAVESLHRAGVDTCVIKMGDRGAEIQTIENTQLIPTTPREVTDTCGAGDFFNAGFIAGMLSECDLESAVRQANQCGGAAVEVFNLGDKLAKLTPE